MIYDISMKINETMMVYKDKAEKKIKRKIIMDYERGESYESEITMNIHTGTHVDAPLHMIAGGKSIDQCPLDLFYGKVLVVDATHLEGPLLPEQFTMEQWEYYDYLLFKTKNSYDETFNPDFVYLSSALAEVLVDLGLKGVGLDALSIEQSANHHRTHHVLLANEVVILEGLRLKAIQAGEYELFCFPILIEGAEGAFVRAVLKDGE